MIAKRKAQTAEAVDLNQEAFSESTRSYSFQHLLDSGSLVNVTAWVVPEMNFGGQKDRWRVQASVTAKVWRTLHQIPAEVRFFQTVRSRGHDVLWIASWALSQARKVGLDCVYFQVVLPTDQHEEDCKTLKIEYLVGRDGRGRVTIGFPDEFPLV